MLVRYSIQRTMAGRFSSSTSLSPVKIHKFQGTVQMASPQQALP